MNFECDYLEGADPRVMQALYDTNALQAAGYGEDDCCARVREIIRREACCPQADVHFVVGGTQANVIVLCAGLRPWEGVLCAQTGHIAVHETGAVEATGHKVLTLSHVAGKIAAEQVQQAMHEHLHDSTHEHMVKPGMVYISHPTEMGTLYTRRELQSLSEVCRQNDLKLYVDGARLGYGLAAEPEVDLPFLASCADAFTIGGTKAGLLFGEAIVLVNDALKPCFRYLIKQHGGMLAKGRLLGVQFEALLADGYYITACARANKDAQRIKDAFVCKGYSLLCDTFANQVFPILPRSVANELRKHCTFAHWQDMADDRVGVRFCVSVTTPSANVEALLCIIEKL